MIKYNLGIVGSRYYENYSEFSSVVNQITDIHGTPDNIVSGGHKDKYGQIKPGTDTLAWKWAQDNEVRIIEHDAEWDKYGRAAGPIRNKLIVKDTDVLLAFVASNSVGTRNTILLAQKDPKIKIYTYDII
jgi:hypothetical protein